MKSWVPEYERTPISYGGCTEAWAREFDTVVKQLVSQAIGRKCDEGKDIRGINITELSIEDVSAITASIVLRIILYAGWRDLLGIKSIIADVLDIHTPVQSTCTVTETSAETQTKNLECPALYSQGRVMPQSQYVETPSLNWTKCTNELEDFLRKLVHEVVQEYTASVNSVD